MCFRRLKTFQNQPQLLHVYPSIKSKCTLHTCLHIHAHVLWEWIETQNEPVLLCSSLLIWRETPSMPFRCTSVALHTAPCFSRTLSLRLTFFSAPCCLSNPVSAQQEGKMSSGENYFRLHSGRDSQLFIHSHNVWLSCRNTTLYTGSVTNTKHPKGFLSLLATSTTHIWGKK